MSLEVELHEYDLFFRVFILRSLYEFWNVTGILKIESSVKLSLDIVVGNFNWYLRLSLQIEKLLFFENFIFHEYSQYPTHLFQNTTYLTYLRHSSR